jgi:HK97 family phage major capsid protein
MTYHNRRMRGIVAVRADASDPVALVAQVKDAVEGIKAQQTALDKLVAKFAEEAKTRADGVEKTSKEALQAAEKAAGEISAQANRIIEIEQKLAEGIQANKAPAKTLGQLVIETDAFKAFAAGNSNRARMEIQANTITGQTGSPAENSDTLVPAQRLAGIIPGAFRTLKVADVIPSGNTTSNMVEYTRELVFTNDAAETAEGDTKPESDLTFELVNAPVRTIAHWIKLSKQVREDAPALASYVDTRMRYGVELRIDTQLLTGNGTGQNISGLLDGGNYTAFSPTAGETELDSINRMVRLVDAADYNASVVMLNPITWGDIERIKGTDDHYVIGDPRSPIGPFLWGKPVVVTNAMPQGKAYVAAIEIVAQQWNRSGVVVEMFEQDDTNVQKNLITVRAEARKALAIYRPASCRYGALTSPGASA